MNPDTQNSPQQQTDKKSFLWVVIVLVALTVCGIVTAAILLGDSDTAETQATTSNAQTAAENPASLSAEPDNATVAQENIVNVSIYVDSGDEEVNAVQANIAYPTDKLSFVSIQTEDSAFSIEAENTNENGVIKLARGEIEPVTGKQLVAVVQLRADSSSGSADLTFAEGSAVISATTNEDLLSNSPGVQLTIEEN